MGTYPRLSLLLHCILLVCLMTGKAMAQDESKSGGVTVKGRLLQNENEEFRVALDDLVPTFNQQIMLPPPPLPDNWASMQAEQRQEWIQEFERSDAGKKLVDKRKELLAAANRFQIQLEPDGQFVIYDVPVGRYALQGRKETVQAGRHYLFEVFGVVDVGENVDEILLDPIMVTATRLLKPGELAPEFEINSLDAGGDLSKRQLDQQHVLLNFWSMKSPPSLEFSKIIRQTLQELQPQKQVLLFSICVDSDRKEAFAQVQQDQLSGMHGYAESWDHPMVEGFGVRSIPALFLLGPGGRIILANTDIQQSLRQGTDLKKVLLDGLQSEPGSPSTDLQTSPSQPGKAVEPDGQQAAS